VDTPELSAYESRLTPRAVSVKVYKAMKRDIIRGVHPAGEALTEKELARKYKG
jgi:DNA-binding GntR family transcriptional regulator